MIGLLYMVANAVAYIFSGTKTALDDHYYKDQAIKRKQDGNNIENLYMDHSGIMRDIRTNKIRHVHADDNGDYWLEDLYGEKIRNLSKEKRDEEFKERSNDDPDRIAVKYTNWTMQNSPIELGFKKLCGTVYKNVKNGDLYIIRRINWNRKSLYREVEAGGEYGCGKFYMRVPDGMLVCLCENEKGYDLKGNDIDDEEVKRFIKFFNQKQKEGGWYDSYRRDNNMKIIFDDKKYYYMNI